MEKKTINTRICFLALAAFGFVQGAAGQTSEETVIEARSRLENIKSERAELCMTGALREMAGGLEEFDPSCLSESQKTLLLMTAAAEGDAEAVSLYIARGADPNATNDDGQTPLQYGALAGNVKAAEALLQSGADPNAQDDNKQTPLRWAALYENKDYAAALLKHGANPNVLDDLGETPLHLAAQHNREITELLLNHGADPNIQSRLDQQTPLHAAVKAGEEDTAALLLKHGAKIMPDGKGRTLRDLCEEYRPLFGDFCQPFITRLMTRWTRQ